MGILALIGQISHDYKYIKHLSRGLQHVSHQTTVRQLDPNLVAATLERVDLYEKYVEAGFLLDGMAVHRNSFGEPIHQCDSLLFSSLRFTALHKLGYHAKAEQAWEAIQKSQEKGQWFRHPSCKKSTSRDMLLGLLVALGQSPANSSHHLVQLVDYINQNSGFFGAGRIDRSFLSPGLAEIIRLQLQKHDLPFSLNHPLFPYSFSTIELAAIAPKQGYRSHLTALSLWLEDDLVRGNGIPDGLRPRSPINRLIRWGEPIFSAKPTVRRQWAAYRLYSSNSENLFFQWLWLKAAGALTVETRNNMLAQLISMPQFPATHPPRDCDRKADYLWQRAASEYHTKNDVCTQSFNGIDFIWMAALLLEDPEVPVMHARHTPESKPEFNRGSEPYSNGDEMVRVR